MAQHCSILLTQFATSLHGRQWSREEPYPQNACTLIYLLTPSAQIWLPSEGESCSRHFWSPNVQPSSSANVSHQPAAPLSSASAVQQQEGGPCRQPRWHRREQALQSADAAPGVKWWTAGESKWHTHRLQEWRGWPIDGHFSHDDGKSKQNHSRARLWCSGLQLIQSDG